MKKPLKRGWIKSRGRVNEELLSAALYDCAGQSGP